MVTDPSLRGGRGPCEFARERVDCGAARGIVAGAESQIGGRPVRVRRGGGKSKQRTFVCRTVADCRQGRGLVGSDAVAASDAIAVAIEPVSRNVVNAGGASNGK